MIEIKTFSPKSHKIKCLIYWPSGAWKTSFGWTADKVIFASSEDGLLSLADKKIPFAKIETIEQLQQLRDFLKNDKHEFETLVIDSITDINERIKKSIEDKVWKAMEQRMWAELSDKIKTILFDIKNIDMNVIIIAQEKYEKDEDKIEKKIPSLNWKLATDICYFMDIVWYIFIDKEWNRQLITNPNEKLLTKDRTKSIWNNTPIDFQKWVELRNNMHNEEEEILYTIMSDWEKKILERQVRFEWYKKELNKCKTLDELKTIFQSIKNISSEQLKEITAIKDDLKTKLK